MRLVAACLNAGKRSETAVFNHRGGAMNHVQARLSFRKELQSSFHHCGGPVWLVQACLCAGKT